MVHSSTSENLGMTFSGARFLLVSGLGDPNSLSLHAWGLHADVWLVSLLFFSMFASA